MMPGELITALRGPFEALLDPGERIFLPFLAASMVLPVVVLGLGKGLLAVRHGLFSWRIWSHGSTRTDINMMFVRALVGVLVRVPWLAATAGAALWIGMQLDEVFGQPAPLAWGRTTVAIVYTVVLFLAWDFSRFFLHRLLHTIPALWVFHQVHHSAEVLNPLTLYRVHPVESLLYDVRGLITTAGVTGLFLYLFRGTAMELQFLGINVIGFGFNALGANLRHSHVWLRFGRFERWLLSPAQHQIHHGRPRDCHQTNYGTWLAIWDRWFGSWRPASEDGPPSFGLERANHQFDSVVSSLIGPVRAAWSMAMARRRWLWWTSTLIGLGAASEAAAAPAPSTDPRTADPVEAPTWTDPQRRDLPAQPQPSEESQQPSQTSEPTAPEDDGIDFELEIPGEDEPAAGNESGEVPDATEQGSPAPETDEEAEDDYDVAIDRISIVGSPDDNQEIVGSAHVIDEEELQRKEYDDIHRVLRQVPGVYVREEDGFGLRPNIGLRGASSDRSAKVTLMEDGILLSPAPYSAPAAYYFPLVTRVVGVEVFKGPASIQHGPNTIGGALNLQTRPIPNEMKGFIDVGAGMRGYGKLHGWWGVSGKRLGVLVEGAHIQSTGFKNLDGGGNTGFDKNDLMVKARYHSDPNGRWYHQVDVKGGLGTEVSRETYLGLTDEDFEETPYRRYAASQRGRMEWWRTQAEAGYFLARGSIFDLQIRGYRHDFHRAWRKFNNFRGSDIRDVLATPDAGQTAVFYEVLSGQRDSTGPEQTLLVGTNDRRFAVTGATAVAHWRPTWRLLEQDIEVGARVHHDQIVRHHTEDGHDMIGGTLVPQDTDTVDTTRNRGSALAGAFHLLDTARIGWFGVMPGARLEVIRTSFENRLTDQESSDTNVVFIPGIGAHAQATPWLGFLAGVHSGFSPVGPGQPDEVEPERSINYEAGTRVNYAGEDTQTRAEAIGFFNDYSNMTSQCTFSSGCDDTQLDRQFNAGRVFVYGVELTASELIDLPKSHWLQVTGAYTYTGSRFRSSFTSANPILSDVETGDELPYVPKHLANLGVGAGSRFWGAHVSAVYVGEMRDVAGAGAIPREERIPRHFVMDLSGQVTPTEHATLYLRIQNLLNNTYMVSRRPFGARPGMPFQLMAGFKYRFF